MVSHYYKHQESYRTVSALNGRSILLFELTRSRNGAVHRLKVQTLRPLDSASPLDLQYIIEPKLCSLQELSAFDDPGTNASMESWGTIVIEGIALARQVAPVCYVRLKC